MTVFELMATLGLDTTDFDTKLSGAVDDVEELSTKAEELTNPKLGGESQTALQPIIDDAKSVDKQLADLQTKTTETSAFMEGLLDAVSDITKQIIEGVIEFGSQSIEAAASTGSELANAFNNAKDEFSMSMDIIKIKTGETLLPLMQQFYELGDAISGTTTHEKLEHLAKQLNELSQVNLEKVREEVKNTFSLFEEVEKVKPGDVGDYQKGLESQTKYWQDYADTLNSLKEKGVDASFLAQIADGSVESMEQLKALDAADTEGLTNLINSYSELQAAQEAAATTMNTTKLSIDENATAIADAMAVLMAGSAEPMNFEDSQAAVFLNTMVGMLTAKQPIVESVVDQINAKLAELGIGGANPLGLGGVKGVEPPEGYVYKGKVGEGEKQSFYTIRVAAELDEESETNLQGEVESMTLQGEAELFADPESGSNLQGYLDTLNLSATVNLVPDGEGLPGYATGLDYVPHDNYVARLHEGEAVLTKQEARRWRRGEFEVEGDGGIVVNQYITVAKNEDFGTEVRNALEMMRWQG